MAMTMTIYSYMYMNIYITKDNAKFLKEIASSRTMSGLVNELLDKYRAGEGADLFPPEPSAGDDYENLIISLAGAVVDRKTGEHIEATPAMVKELKKRGQVE